MQPLHKCCADRGARFGCQGWCIFIDDGSGKHQYKNGDYLMNMPCGRSISCYNAIKECWLEHEGIDIILCIKKP